MVPLVIAGVASIFGSVASFASSKFLDVITRVFYAAMVISIFYGVYVVFMSFTYATISLLVANGSISNISSTISAIHPSLAVGAFSLFPRNFFPSLNLIATCIFFKFLFTTVSDAIALAKA